MIRLVVRHWGRNFLMESCAPKDLGRTGSSTDRLLRHRSGRLYSSIWSAWKDWGEKKSVSPKPTKKNVKTREDFTANLGWWAALSWAWLQPSQAISQHWRSSYRRFSVTLEGSPNVNTARASLPPGRGTYFCSQFMNLWRTVPMTQPWKAVSFIYYA